MSNEDSKNTYHNPFTPCKNQRQKLTLPIHELIKLDEDEIFKITFCCLLAQHLQKNKGLRELLDAVAAYVIEPGKDYYFSLSAGYFEHNCIKVFFRERSNSILIGTLNDSELLCRFSREDHVYFSLNSIKHC